MFIHELVFAESRNNEVLAREGIDTADAMAPIPAIITSNNEVLAREGIDTVMEVQEFYIGNIQ